MAERTTGFIGAGQMARALGRGFVTAGLIDASRIVAFDPVPAAGEQFAAELAGAKLLASNQAVVSSADVIWIAVKPQQMSAVFDEVRPAVSSDKLFVSIAAGIPLARLYEGLGTQRVVRVMPNTPCLVGQGASAFALGNQAKAEDAGWVERLLTAVGTAAQVDEKLLDAVTGLSGSGPAFVYTIIEALSDGGVRAGLPRSLATALAAQTVRGAAEMVLVTGEHPAVLKDHVASPGGTTIAGLQALEHHGVRAALIAAVVAATERSKELGKAS